jgi:hypothetical protein
VRETQEPAVDGSVPHPTQKTSIRAVVPKRFGDSFPSRFPPREEHHYGSTLHEQENRKEIGHDEMAAVPKRAKDLPLEIHCLFDRAPLHRSLARIRRYPCK